MQIDPSAAEQYLSYLDGAVSRSSVWNHPGYEAVREHAALLGRDLTPEDLFGTADEERSAFPAPETVSENRSRIERLVDRVRSRESELTDRIELELRRVTPDADTSDVTVHLGVGYSIGIGIRSGAYINLNESLFHRLPRELLYTAIHESSHVLYEREHDTIGGFSPDPLESADQRSVWNTVFHTEAFATYTPLELRRSDGTVGDDDHPLRGDYAVLSDGERMQDLVAEYDSFRERLRHESVSREDLFTHLFGGSRLPYRVGCALVEGIERSEGPDATREAFYTEPVEFPERYDWALDEYRT